MLEPIQRPPRYRLLLEQLRRCTESEADRAALDEVIGQVRTLPVLLG